MTQEKYAICEDSNGNEIAMHESMWIHLEKFNQTMKSDHPLKLKFTSYGTVNYVNEERIPIFE